MPRDFAIDSSDFADAAKALEQAEFKALADQTVGAVLNRSANAVRRRVREAAKPHRRSGRMAGKVRVYRSGVGLESEFKIHAGGRVAHLAERGFKAHGIVPKEARALTIKGARGRGGSDVVALAASVHNPGYRGDPFFERGVQEARPEVQAQFAAGAETMARNLAFRINRRQR
jgi:hypothetical protein